MALPEIRNMSHRHDAILRWMIANPDLPLTRCAEALGYTRAWLHCIVHSDIFQARLAEMQDELDTESLLTLRQKLTGIAHASADKLMEQLEIIEDPKFLLESMDKSLKKLGYGESQKGDNYFFGATQVNNNTVTDTVLEKAKERRRKAAEAAFQSSGTVLPQDTKEEE